MDVIVTHASTQTNFSSLNDGLVVGLRCSNLAGTRPGRWSSRWPSGRDGRLHPRRPASLKTQIVVTTLYYLPLVTSLVGEEPSHLWPTFPRDPLGFSQIPGHCATQCRVVVIPDLVALTQNKIWVSLTSRRPHTSSTRTRRDQQSQRKCSPSAVARSRAQAASGCRRARATAIHGGAEPAVAALMGASGVKMMRWSAMLNGGVASP